MKVMLNKLYFTVFFFYFSPPGISLHCQLSYRQAEIYKLYYLLVGLMRYIDVITELKISNLCATCQFRAHRRVKEEVLCGTIQLWEGDTLRSTILSSCPLYLIKKYNKTFDFWPRNSRQSTGLNKKQSCMAQFQFIFFLMLTCAR